MSMVPFILLAVGLLLIFLEFFLPGGIMGTIGALVVLGSIVLFAMETDSGLLVVLFTTASILAVVLLFRFALWRIKHGEAGSTIYSDDAQEGYVASAFDETVIGKIGLVSSDLKPGGHILIEDKRHSAISLSGYITKGEKVKVVGGEGVSLTVKLYKES